jgi:hypothetical protein
VAITRRGAQATVAGATGTAVSASLPAGIVAGDLILVCLTNNTGSGTTATTPTGFTLLRRVNDGTTLTDDFFWKRAAGGETTVTSTLSVSSKWLVHAVVLTGVVSTGSPFVVESGQGEPNTTAVTAHDTPSVTNTNSGAWALTSFSTRGGTAATWTPPTGQTELLDSTTSSTSQIASSLNSSEAAVAAATQFYTATSTFGSALATAWVGFVAPEPSATPTAVTAGSVETDTLAATLSTSTALPGALAEVDTLAGALASLSTGYGTGYSSGYGASAAPTGLSAATTEADTLAGALVSATALSAAPTETDTLAGTLVSPTGLSAGLAESATLAGTLRSAVALTGALTESDTLAGTLGTATALSGGLAETDTLTGTLGTATGLAAPLTESDALAGTLRSAVALTAAVTETDTLGAAVLSPTALSAGTVETDTLAGTLTSPAALSGSFTTLVGDWYAAMALSGSEGYDLPTTAQETALADAWGQIVAGDVAGANTTASAHGYEAVVYVDTDTGRTYRVLRETGTWTRFWGAYAFDPAAATELVVQVPHTRADLNTHLQGRSLFQKDNARAFFLATAHRNSNAALDSNGDNVSDVANADHSVFEAVHERHLTAGSPDAVYFQVHGFADASEPSYDIVLSEGDSTPPQRIQDLAASLRTAGGWRVAVHGTVTTSLGATGNVQGIAARAAGRLFVHMEQNTTLRNSATSRGIAEDTVAAWSTPPGSTSLSGSATETDALAVTLGSTTALAAAPMESDTLAAALVTPMALTAGLSESDTLAATVRSPTALTGALTETATLAATLRSAVALAGSLVESDNLAGNLTVAGALTAALVETATLAATLRSAVAITAAPVETDTLAATLRSPTALTGALTESDTLAGTVLAPTVLLAALAESDSLTCLLTLVVPIGDRAVLPGRVLSVSLTGRVLALTVTGRGNGPSTRGAVLTASTKGTVRSAGVTGSGTRAAGPTGSGSTLKGG